MTQEAKDNVVFLDDKELKVKDFNDQQKYFYQQVVDLKNKQTRIQFELDQVKASLSVFQKAFTESFKEEQKESETKTLEQGT